jgi:hypothetical protein
MAIAAIDPYIADVVFMRKLDGLLMREESLRIVRRPRKLCYQPQSSSYEEDGAKDTDLGYDVCAAVEYLRHIAINPRL